MRGTTIAEIEFSVVIPAHNSAQWLGAALTSVYQQVHSPLEVLVFNDSSEDSLEIIARKFPEVIVREVKYKNAAATRNEALKYAKGNYIAFLDADDKWKENHLSSAALELALHPDAVGYINSFDYIDFDDREVHKPTHWGMERAVCMETEKYLTFLYKQRYFVGMSACIVKTSRFREINGFDPKFKRRHDIDMWLRLLCEEKIIVDPNKTSLYRKNVPSSLSSATSETEQYKFKALSKNKAIFASSPIYPLLLRRTAISAIHNALLYGGHNFQKSILDDVSRFLPWYYRIAFHTGSFFPKAYFKIYRLIK